MHIARLVFASPLAAVAAAASITPQHSSTHQIPISGNIAPDGAGPGPFNADQQPFSGPPSLVPGSSSTSSAAAQTYFDLCAGAEGTIQLINNTPYRTYCYNSLWDGYVGLGYHDNVESCESAYSSSTVSPKVGYHWYPSTGACYLFNIPTAELYVYHYGNYEKAFFAPLDKLTPPGSPLCPLPSEGGWSFVAGQWHRLYCRGMAKADPKDVRDYGKTTRNVTECAQWATGIGAKMWHWWQPYQDAAAGLSSGERNCEAIMAMPNRLVPLRTKDTYIAGVPDSSATNVVDMYHEMHMEL